MTDQELEQKLRTALEHAAPDDFQGVLARISPKARTEQTPIPFEAAARKKKRRWARPLAWPWWWRQAEGAGTCKITRWPRWSLWT